MVLGSARGRSSLIGIVCRRGNVTLDSATSAGSATLPGSLLLRSERDRDRGCSLNNMAYVLVRTDDLQLGEDLLRYLRSVDDTLERYGARILVQNLPAEVLEGAWPGFVTLLQFDDLDRAKRWYRSPEYQVIQGLRAGSSHSTAIIVEGVAPEHRSTDSIDRFRLAAS